MLALASNSTETKTVRVIVIEDQRELREGLKTLLDFTPDFRCVQSFGSIEAALEDIESNSADLILTDIGLPRMSGIEGTRILREKFPSLPVIVLTVHGEDDKIFQALCAGASGYLLKNTAPAKIVEAIGEVLAGGAPMSPDVARRVVHLFRNFAPPSEVEYRLTEQERRILKMLVDGHHYKTAAYELGISTSTVSFHLKKHLRKTASSFQNRSRRQSPARKNLSENSSVRPVYLHSYISIFLQLKLKAKTNLEEDKKIMKRVFLLVAIIFTLSVLAAAQTTAFNFQGRLNDGSNPANGRYDLEFRLYDALTGDNIIGTAISKPNTMLVNGVFSTQLNFCLNSTASECANIFSGADRFVEIRLRPTATGSNPPNAFVILGPRQQILSVPYTIRSLRATFADDATHAVNADNATYAANATNATTAQTAVNSQQLGSLPANRYLATDANGDVTINGKVTFNGNVYQPVTAAGLPKAFIQINRFGNILNCYNAATGQSANNCGFTTNHPSLGIYGINFGFNVTNRIIILTSYNDLGDTVATINTTSPNTAIFVDIHYIYSYSNGASDAGKYTDAAFNVVVY